MVHTPESLKLGIARLTRTLESMKAFDSNSVNENDLGAVTALTAQIERAVEKTFGEGTADALRFRQAGSIHGFRSMYQEPHDFARHVQEDLDRGIALITQAIAELENDLAEHDSVSAGAVVSNPQPAPFQNKIFIVHGRPEGPKQSVARFLESLGIEAIILHEQPSQSRSVIEKIEAFGDVDFAIVLMTPDDIGGLANAPQLSRPRQNVLFELGYFIGKLTRSKVCVLKAGEMEMLSDYVGPIWVDFDDAGAWRQSYLVRPIDLGTQALELGLSR